MGAMLDLLKAEQQNLLLGEVAALLHDVGKCHNDFIRRTLGDKTISYSDDYFSDPAGLVILDPKIAPLFAASDVQSMISSLFTQATLWAEPDHVIAIQQKQRDFLQLPGPVSQRLQGIYQNYIQLQHEMEKLLGAVELFEFYKRFDNLNRRRKSSQEPLLPSSPLFLEVGLFNDKFTLGEILFLYRGSYMPFQAPRKDCAIWLLQADRSNLHKHLYPMFLLQRCHGIAHIDKTIADDVKDQPNQAFTSSIFGRTEAVIEYSGDTDLTTLAAKVLLTDFHERDRLLRSLEDGFRFAIADTRLPFNEVTLWDWSWSVAALYKSALAQYIIENNLPQWPQPLPELKWNTLRVTVDVLGTLAKAHRITDVLGYSDAIQDGLDRVKTLIEETYPLGNEIYRDSTGIYFTFPACDRSQDLLAEIRSAIQDIMTGANQAELRPLVDLGKDPWGEHNAQKMLADVRSAGREAILGGKVGIDIDWQRQWQAGESHEICPVCGIRPMQHKTKEYRQQQCNVCRDRAGASKNNWQAGKKRRRDDNERETIWLDEIADQHDRIALIVGRFQLDKWLEGSMISTLLGTSPDKGAHVKEASPSRIHRVWRTTQEFWKWVSFMIDDSYASQQDTLRCQRWKFQIKWDHKDNGIQPGDILDGTLDNVPISLYHHRDGYCVTISNLALFKEESAFNVRQDGPRVKVRKESSSWFTGTLSQATIQPLSTPESAPAPLRSYYPTRTIFTSPDQFMALVPGADALAIAQRIAQQYACEMGKVRSRLPLDLALIYFHRKMPLYAVIDAARRFLDQPRDDTEQWTLAQDATTKDGITTLHFLNGTCWRIPTVFGDGTTEDTFYPYVALSSTCSGTTKDYTANRDDWVHVKKLKAKDMIYVAPSRFSYLWLDSSARRYDAGFVDAEAAFATQNVPLEEIEQLIALWGKLHTTKDAGKMTDTKLHGIVEMLLEKKLAWKDANVFNTFAQAVVNQQKLTITAEDIISGRLFRCFDLHHRIMKQTLAPPQEETHA